MASIRPEQVIPLSLGISSTPAMKSPVFSALFGQDNLWQPFHAKGLNLTIWTV